jgi:hypothetical protein
MHRGMRLRRAGRVGKSSVWGETLVGSFCAFCVMARVGGVWRALAGVGARGPVVARAGCRGA